MASFALDDDRRLDWHYIPKPRKGLPYKRLEPHQQKLADALLGSALSSRAIQKVANIRSLEPVLAEIEQGKGPIRDSELYYVSVFGDPHDAKAWAWSFEGHHISLNFTILADGSIVTTPSFLGANPAEVRHGPRTGFRALTREEDLGRELVTSLVDEQRAVAVVASSAPEEIVSGNSRKVARLPPSGLPVKALSGRQRDVLMTLIEEYTGNMTPALAESRMRAVKASGPDRTYFSWAGALEPGKPHYYRIQGEGFLVEYDKTQNEANHIHTVWRDYDGDFGVDHLGEHYKTAHT